MPILRRVDNSTHVLWTTIQGAVTIDDLHQHLEAVREMHAEGYCEVIDTRAATKTFGARDLPKLVQHGREILADTPMAPRAIVVGRNDVVSFGLARIFAALAMPWVTVRVFDSLPAAVAYIDALISAST